MYLEDHDVLNFVVVFLTRRHEFWPLAHAFNKSFMKCSSSNVSCVPSSTLVAMGQTPQNDDFG